MNAQIMMLNLLKRGQCKDIDVMGSFTGFIGKIHGQI